MANTNYKEIGKIRNCFYTILPLVYDDALSYQEILYKVIAKINEVIDIGDVMALKYANPIQWDITTQYEPNTIVIDPKTGTAYISTQAVPSGVDLNREEYWTVVFDLERFYADFKSSITKDNGINETLSFNVNNGELFWYKNIIRIAKSNIIAGSLPTDENSSVITFENWVNTLINGVNNTINDVNNTINELSTNLNNETSDRMNADNAINQRISDLNEGLINKIEADDEAIKQSIAQNVETINKAIETSNENINTTNQRVNGLEENINNLSEEVSEITQNRKYIFISDSYEEYGHWIDKCSYMLGLTSADYYNVSAGGTSFNDGSWLNLITEWVNSHSNVANTITDIVVVGGLNDSNGSAGSGVLATAILNFMSYVKTNIVNAHVWIGYVGWALNSSPVLGGRTADLRAQTFSIYSRAESFEATYLTGVECAIHDINALGSDKLHPNEIGGTFIAEAVANALRCGATVYKFQTPCQITASGSSTSVSGNFLTSLDKNTVHYIFSGLSFTGNFSIVANTRIEVASITLIYGNSFPAFKTTAYVSNGSTGYEIPILVSTDGTKLYVQSLAWESGAPLTYTSAVINNIYFSLSVDAMSD